MHDELAERFVFCLNTPKWVSTLPTCGLNTAKQIWGPICVDFESRYACDSAGLIFRKKVDCSCGLRDVGTTQTSCLTAISNPGILPVIILQMHESLRRTSPEGSVKRSISKSSMSITCDAPNKKSERSSISGGQLCGLIFVFEHLQTHSRMSSTNFHLNTDKVEQNVCGSLTARWTGFYAFQLMYNFSQVGTSWFPTQTLVLLNFGRACQGKSRPWLLLIWTDPQFLAMSPIMSWLV